MINAHPDQEGATSSSAIHLRRDGLRSLHGWREEIYKTPLGLSWLRRGRSYAYQTTSGHGAKHVQSSHVSPEKVCYNMSGSFRTDYHIDFTGSTTGTADSSSGSAQLIIWRTRRHQAEDNATIPRHGRRTPRGWAMRGHGCWGAMSTTMPPGETGCSGVALGSPVTTCKEDLEVIWVTVISNGHFNMPLGITNMPLRFIDHTVDHNSYRYWGLL